MGTKWRGSAGGGGSKGSLIAINLRPSGGVISGCLVDLYASAARLNVRRDELQKMPSV